METKAAQSQLAEAAFEAYREVMQNREKYVRAWIADTGLHPRDCVLVEQDHGGGRRTIRVVHKDDAPLTASPNPEPGGKRLSPPTPHYSQNCREVGKALVSCFRPLRVFPIAYRSRRRPRSA